MEGFQRLLDLFRNAAETWTNANHPPPANHSLSDSSTASQTQTVLPLAVDSNRKGMKNCPEELKASIADLEKRLQSKSIDLTGQNSTRHQAVLRFLYYQRSQKDKETRQSMAFSVARCFNRGKWFAEKLVSWEISWRKSRIIPEGKQGCFQKIKSWLTDDRVELAIREYLSGAEESKYYLLVRLTSESYNS